MDPGHLLPRRRRLLRCCPPSTPRANGCGCAPSTSAREATCRTDAGATPCSFCLQRGAARGGRLLARGQPNAAQEQVDRLESLLLQLANCAAAPGWLSLHAYNDDARTTKADVVLVLKRAAAHLEAQRTNTVSRSTSPPRRRPRCPGVTAPRCACARVIGVGNLGSLVSLGVLAFGLSSIRIVTDTQALPADMRLLAIDTGDVPVVRLITDADARSPVSTCVWSQVGDTSWRRRRRADSRVTLSDNGSGFLWFDRTGEIRSFSRQMSHED